jgi:hypothetical protein|tara:strand:+ start:619 stop:825 length:207 start_codon:yes stop_codon:yes gene_type:complete
MSLQGQAKTAYANYLNKSMKETPIVEEPMSGGLMNRSRPKADEGTETKDYLMDQFKKLQALRAGLKNG